MAAILRLQGSWPKKIDFTVSQHDSTLVLPKGFAISRDEKFRNQRVLVIIEVPVGKRIQLDRSIDSYEWFTVNFNRRGWSRWDDNWDHTYGWSSNVEYTMTPEGLRRTDRSDEANFEDAREVDSFKANVESNGVQLKIEGKVNDKRNDRREPGYRYQQPKNDNNQSAPKDTTKPQQEISKSEETKGKAMPETVSPLYVISAFAR